MSSVIIGRFTPQDIEALRMALKRGDMESRVAETPEAARALLSDMRAPVPSLILVDAAMIALEPTMTWIRSQARLVGAIVVAIVARPSDHAFAEAVATGCDDVVPRGDLGAITRRAAVLRGYDPSGRIPEPRGRVLIAHPSDLRRRLIGRVLRLAGFDISFASDAMEVERALAKGSLTLCVVAESLPPTGARTALQQHLAGDSDAVPTIVLGTELELRALGDRNVPTIATLDEYSAPDALLFVANELLRPGVKNLRASNRLLWDAMCAFRPAGRLEAALGLTYNLSREGLYVRTLDPPKRGSVLWFELRPPLDPSVVHLRGHVVWVRDTDAPIGGGAPYGFAVRLDEPACPPECLGAYLRGWLKLVGRPTTTVRSIPPPAG